MDIQPLGQPAAHIHTICNRCEGLTLRPQVNCIWCWQFTCDVLLCAGAPGAAACMGIVYVRPLPSTAAFHSGIAACSILEIELLVCLVICSFSTFEAHTHLK